VISHARRAACHRETHGRPETRSPAALVRGGPIPARPCSRLPTGTLEAGNRHKAAQPLIVAPQIAVARSSGPSPRTITQSSCARLGRIRWDREWRRRAVAPLDRPPLARWRYGRIGIRSARHSTPEGSSRSINLGPSVPDSRPGHVRGTPAARPSLDSRIIGAEALR
jgi:hypothetical protein